MFGDIWRVSALYIFEQRGSNLSKMRATCRQTRRFPSLRDLALGEQLVGRYEARANDQPCKIDESLISQHLLDFRL